MRAGPLAAGVALALLAAAAAPPPDRPPEVAADLAVPYAAGAELDVVHPVGARGAPVVVTVHGCCGGRHDLTPLARGLAAAGLVVVNPSVRPLAEGGGWPVSYAQVACALRWARAEAGRYGGDLRRVTVVGWADGALYAGVAALAPPGGGGAGGGGSRGAGEVGCRATGAADDRPAQALVAVGGFLGWPPGPVPAEQVNARTVAFFGGEPGSAAGAWREGIPWTHLGRRPDVAVHLVVGEVDPLLAGNLCFAAGARAAGHPVHVVVAPGAGGQTVVAPRTPEGQRAVAEIVAAARGARPGTGPSGTGPAGGPACA